MVTMAELSTEAMRPSRPIRRRIMSVLITLASAAAAVLVGLKMWRAYVEAPWTRDATVRAYIVTMAPEVAGRIVELGIAEDRKSVV